MDIIQISINYWKENTVFFQYNGILLDQKKKRLICTSIYMNIEKQN